VIKEDNNRSENRPGHRSLVEMLRSVSSNTNKQFTNHHTQPLAV